MATKNWVYGAKTPDIEQAVDAATLAAHRYRNRLCELEIDKRKRHEELLQRLAPGYVAACNAVEAAETRLAEIREAIQAERVKQRTKKPTGCDSLTAEATATKAQLKQLRATRKIEKQAAYSMPAVAEAMKVNTAQHKAQCAEAKTASGLYWGTEAIVRQACGSFASGAPPRFKRYDGEGQLAVQLQGGLDCADAERSNTLCYLGDAIDRKRRWCYIRIGSDGRAPIFARVPIVFHRPLPAGRIKWAYLERRKIASHVRWSIRLTIDCDPETDRCRDGEVAIHTGCRMEPSGLRVCTWLGSDGERGCLRLPTSHCDDYYKLDEIKSQRDLAFNEAIGQFMQWRAKQTELPEWLSELTSHIHQWKSANRLDDLAWRMYAHPTHDDDDIVDRLMDWRKQDKHRWQNERRLSVRIVRRRNDLFRNFAKQMSDRYGVAIVSPIDAKELTENSNPEDLERDNTQAHRHAKWAAVSTLTQCVREKFPLHCIEVSSVDITRQCCNCGTLSASTSRKVQCLECGHTHDVDDNAVVNTLARGEAAIKSGALLELVAAQEDKAASKAAKLAKMQEANRGARKHKQITKELQGKI